MNNEEVLLIPTKNKTERPGKEVILSNSIINNENLSIKIGTSENKNYPQTVYIIISFWVDIKSREEFEDSEEFDKSITREYKKELNNLYKKDLKEILYSNKLFPFYYENIYICDFPDNLNYNNKRSFTSIELNLHTLNSDINNKLYPFKDKEGNELYDELIKISQILSNSKLLNNELNFSIHKKKK